MVGWIILAVLVGLITLIMLIPIGADLRYEDEVIRVSAKAAGFKIQLIPKKKREPKAEKAEEKPKPEPVKEEDVEVIPPEQPSEEPASETVSENASETPTKASAPDASTEA